jgi:hypothetical protein
MAAIAVLTPLAAVSCAPDPGSPKGPPTAPDSPAAIAVDPDGTVHLPAMTAPFSQFASPQARQAFVEWVEWNKRFGDLRTRNNNLADIPAIREKSAEHIQPMLDRSLAAYPVTIEIREIGGIYAEIITPKGGVSAANKDRALVNVRSISTITDAGAHTLGRLESIPIAATARITVIALGNRDGADYKFPQASADIAKAYRVLLRRYKPGNIGFFGSSRGGLQVAQSLAWFQKEGLPRPGAAALLCSGATGWMEGDASYVAQALDGFSPLPETPLRAVQNGVYHRDADLRDPLVAPGWTQTVLKKFPPTLLISGSRDSALSSVLYTHETLVDLGVAADLHVWEGLNHDFFYDIRLPESVEAYKVIARFFDRHLGSK